MSRQLTVQPLNKEAFAPYGEVIEKEGASSFLINNGKCRRHHALALADVETGEDAGRVGMSIFSGKHYELPLPLKMVERHPLGSQAFFPLGKSDWLVIVCTDQEGTPVNPQVFLASSHQGVNINRNQWHGVLTPLHEPSDFLVMDRIGETANLEEYFFDEPFVIPQI